MNSATLTHRYNDAASWWSARLAELGYPAAYRQRVAELARPSADVCDMGAGCGDFAAAYVAEHGAPERLLLVDPAGEMLERAAARFVETPEIRAETLEEFDGGPFPLVLSAHLIEHCADPAKAMVKLAAITAPGGTLILVTNRPHWCQWFIWLRWQHRWFSAAKIFTMGEAAGLLTPRLIRFAEGVPSRTSFGYVFTKPNRKDAR